MSTSKYLLLDWDGCMANTLAVWMDTYQRLYKEVGLIPTQEEIIQHSWGNLAQGPKYFGIADFDAFWKKIVSGVKKGVAHVPLYSGVRETLVAIKALGIPMAIVTSSERQLLEPALQFHGLDSVVDYVVTEEDVTKPKPDPEMLLLALKKMKGTVEEALIIGDSRKDIQAGKNGGLKTVLILHPENERFYDFSKLNALQADVVITSFPRLLGVLK